MGFIFGYLLYCAVRHTKEFNIGLLSSAFGAAGGGVVIALFGQANPKEETWKEENSSTHQDWHC
jgi:hypothetical protein